MRDASGASAEAILTALARDPPQRSPLLEPVSNFSSPSSSPEKVSASLFPSDRREGRDLASKLDPLLITIFVDCPHTFTTSTFSRLLMWCIKTLRRKHARSYLLTPPVGDTEREEAVETSGEEQVDPVLAHRQYELRVQSCRQYKSCVTRFIGKLMLLMDYYQPEDLMEHRGNESLSDLLMRFACLGEEEKQVLVSYGAIYR